MTGSSLRTVPFFLLTFLAGLLLVATLLPLWRNPHWLVRGWDFPRLQLFAFAALLLTLELVLLDRGASRTWALAFVTTACGLYQAWWIAPYTVPWPNEVRLAKERSPERTLRLMTANVLQTNRKAQALIDLVHRFEPDVLVALETDTWWEAQLAAIEDVMPHTIRQPQDNLYGMNVWSRLPLSEVERLFLVQQGIPSMHCRIELPNGQGVRMHFLHPAPPSPSENEKSSQRDAELVIVAKSVADSHQPVVVTGDLNDVAWSTTTRLFRKLSGLLDPRVGRGMYNTFHADYPFLRWPLDHVFHSQHFTLAHLERLPSIGSDHFPIFTELVFNPLEGADQNGIDPDADDRSLAERIRADQGVAVEAVPEPGEGLKVNHSDKHHKIR